MLVLLWDGAPQTFAPASQLRCYTNSAHMAMLVQVFDTFDVEGEGWLGYEGMAALVRRQLPDITSAELRSIMGHIHLLDKDGRFTAAGHLPRLHQVSLQEGQDTMQRLGAAAGD